MPYPEIIFTSLIYLLIGFGINKKNAKYLLAGYNTMSQEKKQAVDIDGYLAFFKPFFKKLSLFPPVSFLLCPAFLKGDDLINTWSIIQLLPFVFFLRKSLRF